MKRWTGCIRFTDPFALFVVGLILALGVLPGGSRAATPPSGTVSETNLVATWTGPFKAATGSATCNGPNDPACDNFALTIVPPSAAFGPFIVEIRLQPALAGDWDLQVYLPGGGPGPSSGNSPGQVELVTLSNPGPGTYTVAAAPFAPVVGPDVDGDLIPDSYIATATMKKQSGVVTPPGTEPISYGIHPAPAPLGRGAAEPSIGANHKSDNLMFISGLQTLRISFDDCSSPAKPTWKDVSFATTSITSLDPILFTDSKTGRTFVSQLTGQDSLTAFTDNDGDSWTPSQGGGIPSGVDHQTVGGGRFHDPLTRDPNLPIYPHAVYYCSQDIATAFCARSDNGGLTFGPGVPTWTLTQCGGLHGAVKVAPDDGTVYVPNKGCDGEQGVAVSEDNGISWTVRTIPTSSAGEWDPSVGIATDGTVYFGYGDGDGHPKVAVSHDKGVNWDNIRDVGTTVAINTPTGTQTGIQHTSFSVMVAGDPDRAAYAALGSTEPTAGSGADNPDWPGDWYLIIAHTYDGGNTWTTINATPGDPVQRGTIFSGGFTPQGAQTRNLLDFIDSDIEREGRVVVAYADGCIGDCVNQRPNSFTEVATVARQVNGKRMFAVFDQLAVPSAPTVTATFGNCPNANRALVHLSWSTPDDHGSPITGYNIYRRTTNGNFAFLTSVGAGVNTFDDTVDPNQTYFYQVTAVNVVGEGLACGEVSPSCPGFVVEDPCVVPGKTVLTDPSGDDLPPSQPELDIESVSFAGLLTDGTPRLVVTVKVGNLEVVPPNASWRTVWTFNGVNYFVAMNNCSIAGVTFTYGTLSGNLFTTLGSADAGAFSADGTITITIAASKVGNPAAGQALTAINGRTQTFVGAQCSGLLVTEDSTENGSFTLSSCVAGTPEARDDAATTTENIPVVINVLANDSDPNGDPISVIAIKQPANGTATNNGDGTVTYDPNTNFNGTDSFTYTISDPGGLTDTATVTVTVNPFCPFLPTGSFFDDLEPMAEPGWGVDTTENNLGPSSPTWQVLVDPNANSPSQSWFSDATTLDLKDDRLVAPPQDLSSTSQLIFWHRFRFEDSFDGGVLEVSTDGGSSWVDVLAGGGSFVGLTGYNGTIDAGFGSPIAGRQAWTGGFIDAVLAPMEQVVVNMGAFAGFGVRVRFRLAADPLAIGSFPGHGWWIDDIEFTNTLELSNCNRPPNAVNDTANTTQNTPVTISVLANDTDPENDTLTVTSVTQPANGSVANNGTSVTYSPNTGFTGTDTFTYTISDGNGNSDTATVTVTVNERRVTCLEDDDPRIEYDNGWHMVSDPDASAGHFRFNTGKDNPPHAIRLAFDVPTGQVGELTYYFARSPKGGTADVYIDGIKAESISYAGSSGRTRDPDFCGDECRRTYTVTAGPHAFELRAVRDAVYVDRFCLENSSDVTSQPTSGPGPTTSSVNVLAAAQELVSSLGVPVGTLEISVMVEPGISAPIRLVLIDPSGSILETAETTSGFAVIEKSVSQSGLYLIKVLNLGLGPVEVWTAATPLVAR